MAKPRNTLLATPQRLILDSGAVIALSRRDVRARAILAGALEVRAEVVIPSVVLTETLRGSPRDAPVNHIVTRVDRTAPLDDAGGRLAGGLLGDAHSDDTVDAMVVATAIRVGGGVILTSDPDDLVPLAQNHPEIVVRSLDAD